MESTVETTLAPFFCPSAVTSYKLALAAADGRRKARLHEPAIAPDFITGAAQVAWMLRLSACGERSTRCCGLR